MCRCKNAETDITSLVESVGRVPVKARQLIRHWSAWPGSRKASSSDNNVRLRGDQRQALSVYIHEVDHTLDSWFAGSNGRAYSITGDEWARAIAADSCVTDDYGRTSFVEDFAQCGVMATYDLNVASINNFPVSCMRNQFDLCKQKLSGALKYNPSDKCDPAKRWTNTYVYSILHGENNVDAKAYLWGLNRPAVCMGPEARNQGLCNGVPNAKRSLSGLSLTDLDKMEGTIPCIGIEPLYSYGNLTA